MRTCEQGMHTHKCKHTSARAEGVVNPRRLFLKLYNLTSELPELMRIVHVWCCVAAGASKRLVLIIRPRSQRGTEPSEAG